MESTGEEESVTLCSKIDIKEEPILTDQQPEIEQIYVKEETAKLEIPEDHDGTDPLQVNKDECVLDGETTVTPDASLIKQDPECMLEEETTSTPDELPIKQESEVQIEQESTSCGSEPESNSLTGEEDCRTDGLMTSMSSSRRCTTNEEATCGQSRAIKYLVLSCTICNKIFASAQDLKEHSHIYLHSCGVCHKTFTSGFDMRRHMMSVHTDELPHSCEVCQKSFSTGGYLKRHFRLHTEDRRFVCEMCHRTYKTSGHLKRHLVLHTGERAYACKVCHKTFVYQEQLRRHSCECISVCDICRKPYKTNRYLHARNRLVNACESCDKSFRRSSHPKQYPSKRGRAPQLQ